MTEESYRDRLHNLFCHDREISITIDFSRVPVATEVSLSRQSLPVRCRNIALWCRDKVGLPGRCCDGARATVHVVCAHYAHDRPYDSAQCCTLFGSPFMDTVHEHCSWMLFKKKKEYKNDPRDLRHHTRSGTRLIGWDFKDLRACLCHYTSN